MGKGLEVERQVLAGSLWLELKRQEVGMGCLAGTEETGPYLKPGGGGPPSFAGISRSTTIVTAYVMTVTGLGWRDVLEAIKATRPIANPNPGFRQQLEEFGWGNSGKVGAGAGLGWGGKLFAHLSRAPTGQNSASASDLAADFSGVSNSWPLS